MRERIVNLTCEAAPVQYEGKLGEYPFYFRARGRHATFSLVEPGDNPVLVGLNENEPVFHVGFSCGKRRFCASYMPHHIAEQVVNLCLDACDALLPEYESNAEAA